ncbi:MAG: hypothetical protein H0X37_03535 [Herpetosiphonaceae bacterium]|nr:hypothetical protein [Herpetosiphonaceae bacterium]
MRENIRTLRIRQHGTVLVQRSNWLLAAAAGLNFLGYLSWFLVLHLHSVGWAPGQVLDLFPGYWSWFYRIFFSADEVFAARRSQLAAHHPALQIAAWLVMAVAFIALLRRIRATPSLRLRVLLGLAGLFSVPLLLVPNLLSGDVYSYISFGRIAAIYGANPFIDPPAAFPLDPYFHFIGWINVPSVYGPTWIYLSMVVTALVEATLPHVATYVLAYKLLALGLHLLNGVLLWRILCYWRPEQRAWGTALYLLNPLALTEFASNGHNDVLMITLILVAILLHLRGYWPAAVVALTLAVLTKWIALPLVGLYSILLLWQGRNWGQRVRYALVSTLVFATLCVVLYAPYWEASGGWDQPGGRYTLRVLFDAPPQKRLINSLGDMVASEYGRLMYQLGKWPNPAIIDMGPTVSAFGNSINDDTQQGNWQAQQEKRFNQYIREQKQLRDQVIGLQQGVQDRVRQLGLVVFGLVCVAGVLLTRNLRTMLLASAWILFTYATLTAVWVWPWYATWFVALAALLDWRVAGRGALLLSLLVLLLYPMFPVMPEPTLLERYRALIVFGPPLGFVIIQGVKLVMRWRQHEVQMYDERAFA